MYISKLISTFFYTGYLKYSSGTFASILTALIWYYFIYFPPLIYIVTVIGLSFAGVFFINNSLKYFTSKDPKAVVFDEVCGMLISFIALDKNLKNLVLAFVLFRIFDIFKPFYIRKLESLPKGYGIMADDILAGVYTFILVNIINYLGGFLWI